jgi:hypothetical protein
LSVPFGFGDEEEEEDGDDDEERLDEHRDCRLEQ